MGTQTLIRACLAIAAAAGLTACGTSSTATSASTTTTPVNPAADRTAAEAINLSAADLAGWLQSPNPPDPNDQSVGAQMSACAGGPPANKIDVVEVSSPNFSEGSIEVSSDVQTVTSHSEGLADLKSIESPKLASCAVRIAKPALAKDLPAGATVTKFAVSTFKPTESIADAFGLNLEATVAATENGVTVSVPVFVREIGFLVGRAEITLNEDERGSPVAVPMEANLIRLLDSRARAQSSI